MRDLEGDDGAARVADDGEVGAVLHHRGLADLGDLVAVRDLALGVVQAEVLQEDDRVVVADGGGQQRLGVGRGRGATTFRPGTWAYQTSRFCEWVAASCCPPPPGVRMTIGTETCPPNIDVHLRGVVHDLVDGDAG